MAASLEEIQVEILRYLFDEYKKSSNSRNDISPIVNKHNENHNELGKLLLDKGLIKNQMFLPTTFICQITLAGIDQIEPSYYSHYEYVLLQALNQSGSSLSAMKVLEFEPKDNQRMRDIVHRLKSRGLVEALFSHSDAHIEISIKGREFIERNSARFFP